MKVQFYTKINKTIVKCDKVETLKEILINSMKDFIHFPKEQQPMPILVEQKILDLINIQLAKLACSKYHTKRIDVHINNTFKPVIQIRSVNEE